MTPAEARELLERTGKLFTQHDDDPGHISDFWRKRIEELCVALESAPLDAAELLQGERQDHEYTRSALAAEQREADRLRGLIRQAQAAADAAEKEYRAALLLVDDAVPRMRTLNNAMSPGWLARAAELRR